MQAIVVKGNAGRSGLHSETIFPQKPYVLLLKRIIDLGITRRAERGVTDEDSNGTARGASSSSETLCDITNP